MYKDLIKKIILTIAVFILCIVSASAQTEGTLYGAVIDERCVREKVADPSGPYARFCQRDNNQETYIICLNRAFPEERSFFGIFDLFESRFRVTAETLPSLIRAVIIIAFGIVGVTALWMAIWGYFKWITALNSSPEDAAKVWRVFTNGVWGLLFALGSLLLTWGIFYAAGVRRNDFFEVGNEISNLLSLPCEDLSANSCSKFNYSCKLTGDTITSAAVCTNNTEDEKNQTIRGMPTPAIPNDDEEDEITYQGDNPCG